MMLNSRWARLADILRMVSSYRNPVRTTLICAWRERRERVLWSQHKIRRRGSPPRR